VLEFPSENTVHSPPQTINVEPRTTNLVIILQESYNMKLDK